MTTTLRLEEPSDQAAIHALNASCFPTAGEADLVDALRGADKLTLSLVIVEQGQVLGHVAFSPVELPGVSDALGLAPVAVHAEHRRRGLADRLIREALSICEARGFAAVVVLGDPAYYGRFGFEAASKRKLVDEYGGGAAFQCLELRAGSIPAAGGSVRYAQEFAALDD